jgi:hypothetical protein
MLIEAAVACSSTCPRRIRLRAAQVAMPRWLPRTHAVSTPVDRHAGDDRVLSGASDRRGHRHGHRHQPGHVCRTSAVRRAVARAAVPEAADGQSADRSGSFTTSSALLKAARRPGSDTTVTGEPASPSSPSRTIAAGSCQPNPSHSVAQPLLQLSQLMQLRRRHRGGSGSPQAHRV